MKEECIKCLATCQMWTLAQAYSGAGVGIESMITDYGLNDDKFIELATKENLPDWFIEKLKSVI